MKKRKKTSKNANVLKEVRDYRALQYLSSAETLPFYSPSVSRLTPGLRGRGTEGVGIEDGVGELEEDESEDGGCEAVDRANEEERMGCGGETHSIFL